MDNFDAMLGAIEQRVPVETDTYTGEDGMKRCKRCGGPVECKITMLGIERIVRCMCPCEKARLIEIEERDKKLQEIERNRRDCFDVAAMRDWTFANDDKANLKISEAMERYADQFEQFLHDSSGLLLFGNCGTGKSYFAACIANKLIDNGYTAKMTNFATLINRLQGMFEGRNEYISGLNHYQLLVIDDLGAERSTPYMQEIVFNIIDSRYRSGLPMIITTNLTSAELKHPGVIENERIYDRILERCLPVEVSGQSRRKQKLRETAADIRGRLGL